MPNRGARLLEKALESAMHHAEDRGAGNVERLRIVDARADVGPSFKRVRSRARGMAFMIIRRMSHRHVTIDAPEVAERGSRSEDRG